MTKTKDRWIGAAAGGRLQHLDDCDSTIVRARHDAPRSPFPIRARLTHAYAWHPLKWMQKSARASTPFTSTRSTSRA